MGPSLSHICQRCCNLFSITSLSLVVPVYRFIGSHCSGAGICMPRGILDRLHHNRREFRPRGVLLSFVRARSKPPALPRECVPRYLLEKVQADIESSQFGLQSIHPPQGGLLASHCTSRLTEGQTLSWYSGVDSGTIVSVTTVFTSPVTMFAVPVNGFNIAAASQTGQQDSTAVPTHSTTGTSQTTIQTPSQTSPSPQSSSSSASSGTSTLGLSIGVTLGAALAVFLLVSAVFVLRRGKGKRDRWLGGRIKAVMKRSGSESGSGPYSEETVLATVPAPCTYTPAELPLNKPRAVHELAAPRWIRELPQG